MLHLILIELTINLHLEAATFHCYYQSNPAVSCILDVSCSSLSEWPHRVDIPSCQKSQAYLYRHLIDCLEKKKKIMEIYLLKKAKISKRKFISYNLDHFTLESHEPNSLCPITLNISLVSSIYKT